MHCRIPKQPMSGMGHHANDSFRELAVMWMKHNDVKLELIDNTSTVDSFVCNTI